MRLRATNMLSTNQMFFGKFNNILNVTLFRIVKFGWRQPPNPTETLKSLV